MQHQCAELVCMAKGSTRPRLQRLEQLFTTEPVFFITMCTGQRRHLLGNRILHSAFLSFAEAASSHGVFVGRYILMPDHIHVFAAFTSDSPSLSLWIRSLKNSLSKELRQQHIDPPHWQKGFFDHLRRTEESYAEKWSYVVCNPVRAGLVKSPEEWPYQGEIQVLELRRS